jgi:hypothetical protein
MRTIVAIGVVAALAGVPVQAQAENGFAAGMLGGLAAGAIIGSAARPAPPPAYYYPAPVYAPPPVAYVPPAPSCYYTLGRPVWDGYRGTWVRPQVQVCD